MKIWLLTCLKSLGYPYPQKHGSAQSVADYILRKWKQIGNLNHIFQIPENAMKFSMNKRRERATEFKYKAPCLD